MTSNPTWGRKENIVWPPHAPIYTFSALGLAVLATVFFVWQHLRFSESVLRRTYTPAYIRASVGAALKQHGKYRLLYVGGGKAAPRLALPVDFIDSETRLPNGSSTMKPRKTSVGVEKTVPAATTAPSTVVMRVSSG